MYEKAIVYDPETRDFAMYLNGDLAGFARTYQEAEQTLDDLVYELIEWKRREEEERAASIAALQSEADAADAERFAREDALYGAYVEAHGHDPRDWPAPSAPLVDTSGPLAAFTPAGLLAWIDESLRDAA